MSEHKEDGGPAYPGPWIPEDSQHYKGMTLRDYFAAAALTGLLADHTLNDWHTEEFAMAAYEAADAMIEERG